MSSEQTFQKAEIPVPVLSRFPGLAWDWSPDLKDWSNAYDEHVWSEPNCARSITLLRLSQHLKHVKMCTYPTFNNFGKKEFHNFAFEIILLK